MVGFSLYYRKDAGKHVLRDKHVVAVVAVPKWIVHVVVMGFGRRFGVFYARCSAAPAVDVPDLIDCQVKCKLFFRHACISCSLKRSL